jgi:cell division protein FtsN
MLETEMATFRRSAAAQAAFVGWTVVAAMTWSIAGLALVPVSAAANQVVGSDDQKPQTAGTTKPGADDAPPSGQAAVDPKAPLPPADARPDARELVKRRMELCRQRPEICEQEGEKRDAAGGRPPEGTSKD